MVGGKPVRPGVLADVRKAKRLRIPDQLAEEPVASRERPDPGAGLLIDTDEEEALELLLCLVEDPQGGVAGARELARSFEHLIEDALLVQFGDQPAPNLEESLDLPLV